MSLHRRAVMGQLGLCALSASLAPIRSAFADTTEYVYDTQGRLVLVKFDDGSSVQYSYDDGGNRTQVVRSATTPTDTFTATIQITGTTPVNLRTLANAAGYNGAKHAVVTYQLGAAVTLTGATGAPDGGIAVDGGDWPYTLYAISLALQVSGKIRGGGGKGGAGAVPGDGAAGGIGGDAVYCRAPMSITVNSGGEIKSGGGGGGGGGGRFYADDPSFDYAGGGGGGGFPNGAGGLKGHNFDGGPGAADGSPGTVSGGGAGGAGETGGGGAGRQGGGAGAAGIAGNNGSGAGDVKTPGAGGAAGYAIRKNGFVVSVTNNGTITGTVG
jgi:YD repeat-containing protein